MSEEEEEEERLRIVGDYKHGSIRRVTLKNFLTYSDVDFVPGPRLNMVIGPNGTGKSTLLCAICLGLGGEPRLLGRASEIGTFVANGEDVGEIEIEIVDQKTDGPNPIVKRIIHREGNKSQFYWNGKSTSGKKVREMCLGTYHISVDNLCTFLPQDRVGSFSGFDAKQLLIETEKASSSSQDLYHTHMELMKAQEDLKGGTSRVENMQEQLEKLQNEHSKWEREKLRMEERQIALEQAELFKKKIIWLKFDQGREAALEKKKLYQEAKQKFKEKQEQLQPLREQHEEADEKLKQSKKEYSAMDKQIKKYQNDMTRAGRKYENFDDGIETTLSEIQSIDSQRRMLEHKVEEQKGKVASIKASLDQSTPLATLEEEEREARHEVKQARPTFDRAKRELTQIKEKEHDVASQRKQVQQKLIKLQDDKMQRRNRIFRQQQNLEKIYKWIQDNRALFRKEVIGPIACEITPQTNNAAAYIEQHLPNAVLKSFVVQDKKDYDLLFQKVRQELKIPINIALTEQIKPQKPRIYSNAKLKILREQHGVLGYLDESYTAPDVVCETLRAYGVEKVLVGNDQTQRSIDDKALLQYLSEPEDGSGNLKGYCIFASQGNHSIKYTAQISSYSRKAQFRPDDVKPARWLAPGVPEEEKRRVQKELEDLEQQYEQFGPQTHAAQQKVSEFQEQATRSSQRLRLAQENVKTVRQLTTKLKSAERKLKDSEEALATDDDQEKQRKIAQLKKQINASLNALEEQAQCYKKMMQTTVRCSGMRLNCEVLKAEEERLRAELAEAEAARTDAQNEYQSLNTQFKEAKKKLTDLKEEADQLAPINDPETGDELPLRAELEALPFETLDEAEDALDEANRKADSIHSDPNVIREYEKLELNIEKLQTELDNLTNTREQQINALKQKVKPWEARLANQVNKLDALFSVYMRETGCTGEVVLNKGNPEEGAEYGSFKDWGIEIRVSFREGTKPQVLSARVQSGGERSVSTIMYLMAMQGMMVSPFRCVDEINQGLDDRNERLVFKRIVANSTQEPGPEGPTDHCGQYFLITPKLLPNLYDMEVEAMTVLVIFNGPYNFKSPRDWNVQDLIRKRVAPEAEENDENAHSNVEGRIAKRAKVERRDD